MWGGVSLLNKQKIKWIVDHNCLADNNLYFLACYMFHLIPNPSSGTTLKTRTRINAYINIVNSN